MKAFFRNQDFLNSVNSAGCLLDEVQSCLSLDPELVEAYNLLVFKQQNQTTYLNAYTVDLGTAPPPELNSRNLELKTLLERIRDSLRNLVCLDLGCGTAGGLFRMLVKEYCESTGCSKEDALNTQIKVVSKKVFRTLSYRYGFDITPRCFFHHGTLELDMKMHVIIKSIYAESDVDYFLNSV